MYAAEITSRPCPRIASAPHCFCHVPAAPLAPLSLLLPDGWGTLELNQSHMVWSFLRNNDPWNPPGGRVGDQAVYTRDAAA